MIPLLPGNWPSVAAAVAILAVVAWAAGWVATRILHRVISGVTSRTRSTWDDRLIERGVFRRLARVVPAVVVYLGIVRAFEIGGADLTGDVVGLVSTGVRRVAAAYIAFAVVRAFQAFLDAVNDIYNEGYAEARSRPIKGYLQVATLVAYLAAVLMLVFRDTILSLVASIQIASNDMIRIGDWVSVPQAGCDGEVIDIALHTVKVQNWDKTISTIPTNKFITESFKNWRGMSESGGRRIKRSLRLDMNSVRFLTDDEIGELSRRELLQDYMRESVAAITRYNEEKAAGNPGVIPEIRRLTNLGTFRVYVQKYLEAHPKTHKDMTLLTRQLAPGPEGVPIEVYCFSNDTAWANYEGFQGDIFDHLIATLPEFGLRAFQAPGGSDFRKALGGGNGRT